MMNSKKLRGDRIKKQRHETIYLNPKGKPNTMRTRLVILNQAASKGRGSILAPF